MIIGDDTIRPLSQSKLTFVKESTGHCCLIVDELDRSDWCLDKQCEFVAAEPHCIQYMIVAR